MSAHFYTISFTIHLNQKAVRVNKLWKNAFTPANNSQLAFVGNKAKLRISKRVSQKNKASRIFRKTNISYLLICTRECVYQGARNVRFSENLTCFDFLKHPFEIRPFALLSTIYLFRFSNRNTRNRCETCSKLTIKTTERRHWC